MKRTGIQPVTAPMTATSRAVVRPAFTRSRTFRQQRCASSNAWKRAPELEQPGRSVEGGVGRRVVPGDVGLRGLRRLHESGRVARHARRVPERRQDRTCANHRPARIAHVYGALGSVGGARPGTRRESLPLDARSAEPRRIPGRVNAPASAQTAFPLSRDRSPTAPRGESRSRRAPPPARAQRRGR